MQRPGLALAAINEEAAEGDGITVAHPGHVDPPPDRHRAGRAARPRGLPVGTVGRFQVQCALRVDQQGKALGGGLAGCRLAGACRPADDVRLFLRIAVQPDPGLDGKIPAGEGGFGHDAHGAVAVDMQRSTESAWRCDGGVAEHLAVDRLRRSFDIGEVTGVEGAEEPCVRVRPIRGLESNICGDGASKEGGEAASQEQGTMRTGTKILGHGWDRRGDSAWREASVYRSAIAVVVGRFGRARVVGRDKFARFQQHTPQRYRSTPLSELCELRTYRPFHGSAEWTYFPSDPSFSAAAASPGFNSRTARSSSAACVRSPTSR